MAVDLALTSECYRARHGAIVVKGRRILSSGVNTYRNKPAVFDNPNEHSAHFTYHAEIRAIKPLSADALRGATIYVARVFRSGLPGLSRPCTPCYMELLNKGIKKVVFTVG